MTGVAALMLSFVNSGGTRQTVSRAVVLAFGLLVLYAASRSAWLDERLSHLISWALRRWTELEVRDYANLLGLGDGYAVTTWERRRAALS